MAKNKTETEAATITPKSVLVKLIATSRTTAKRAAEERGTYGTKVKAAEEEHNLDAKAFKMIAQLAKLDPARLATRWANMKAYAELLGFDAQGDLFEKEVRNAGGDTRTPIEREIDGDKMSDGEVRDEQARQQAAQMERDTEIDKLVDGGAVGDRGEKATSLIAGFRRAMEEASTGDMVNRGLDRFSTDHPELADEVMPIAEERLRVLARTDNTPRGSQPSMH